MYSVSINGDELIHSPFVDSLKLIDPKVVKAINEIDSFEFAIYPNHPAYDKLYYLITQIEIWNEQTGNVVFRGRILEPRDQMDGNGEVFKEFVCEGELAYLHDTKQRWKKFPNVTIESYVKSMIAEHNSQVESYKKFEVGVVDVSSIRNDFYTDEELSTYETIENLIEEYGGEIQVRYENGIRYIDYLKQIGKKGTQKIELSVNLKSFIREIDPSEIVTVLKPLGQEFEYEDGNENATSPRLTIESVNNGSVYLRDEAKISQFGIKVDTQTWDDVVIPAELKTKGTEFLSNQKIALVKYQVDAVDLAPIGLAVESFECGWTYDVYNPIMGIDEELRVVGQSIDINNPAESTLSIGDKILTQEQYNAMLNKQIKSANNLKKQVDSQSRSIGLLRTNIETTQQNLSDLQTAVETGSGTVQNQIAAVLEEMQNIVAEMQNIAASVPSSQVMQEIQTAINDLNTFKQSSETFINNQTNTNTDFEQRISALEEPQEGGNE